MNEKPHHLAPVPDLAPPAESRVSTVLNGVGNGMMLGAVPLIATKMYEQFSGNRVPYKNKIAAFATVGGCLVGAWYGIKESNLMHDYRQAMTDEIRQVRDEVNRNSVQLDRLAAKVDIQALAGQASSKASR